MQNLLACLPGCCVVAALFGGWLALAATSDVASASSVIEDKAPTRPTDQPTTKQPSLVGKWSSVGLTIAFREDGSFTLVHIRALKQTVSGGKYTLAGNQLTLTTAGEVKTTASISKPTDKSIELRLPGSGAKRISLQKVP